QGRVDRTAHAADDLAHLGDLVAADKRGANVEGVRAFLDLLAAHFDTALPIALLLQAAEAARAVGVAALADRQIRILLAERDLAVERGDRRRPLRRPLLRHGAGAVTADTAQHLVEGGDVRRLGTAAAADDVDPVLDSEA